MAGYCKFSMSQNAVAAYKDGEMPISKWTKAELLSRCGEKAKFLSRLTVAELRKLLLTYRGWHHTSSRYNRTQFYGVDKNALETVTEADVDKIVSARAPKQSKPEEKPVLITAKITYVVWEGQYKKHRRPVEYTETVTYKSTDKLICTQHGGNKRISSLKIQIIKEG